MSRITLAFLALGLLGAALALVAGLSTEPGGLSGVSYALMILASAGIVVNALAGTGRN